MAIQTGDIIQGKVTGLTKFGAFVELPENRVGMVHISEVSNQFVKEISDFLEKGQMVTVKVLNIDENNKISLSIKKAVPEGEEGPKPKHREESGEGQQPRRRQQRSAPNVWTGPKKSDVPDHELTFDEMMAKFKSESDDKLADLKRSTESKHGGFSRRGGKRY